MATKHIELQHIERPIEIWLLKLLLFLLDHQLHSILLDRANSCLVLKLPLPHVGAKQLIKTLIFALFHIGIWHAHSFPYTPIDLNCRCANDFFACCSFIDQLNPKASKLAMSSAVSFLLPASGLLRARLMWPQKS